MKVSAHRDYRLVGTDLECTARLHPDTTEFVEPVVIPFGEPVRRAEEGEILDSKTILCAVSEKGWMEKG